MSPEKSASSRYSSSDDRVAMDDHYLAEMSDRLRRLRALMGEKDAGEQNAVSSHSKKAAMNG